MFKILIVILGLAVLGANSLLEKMSGPRAATLSPSTVVDVASAPNPTPPEEPSWLGRAAFTAATKMTGMDTAPLPPVGCADSAPSSENLEALMQSLPDEQREALLRLIQLGSTTVTMRWYSGELGLGLCLPSQGQVVLLPAQVTQALGGMVPHN